MQPIVILEHSPEGPPGYLADAIDRVGLPYRLVRLHDGDDLPDLAGVSAVVSLGGKMGAYDEAEYPFLAAEKALLVEAVARDIPVLGICLGCQLLADALGGRAYLAGEIEVVFSGLELSTVAATDPVLRHLSKPVVCFHQDTWDVPPQADVLVTSDRFPHAFRLGSAVGIQSHPEVSAEIVAEWVEGFGRDVLESGGIDAERFLADIRAGAEDNEARAAELFDAWLREVTDRAYEA